MKNDGAVLLLVMEKSVAESYGLHTGLAFVDHVSTGVDPNVLGIGPVPAVKNLLAKQAFSVKDID